MGVRAGMPRGLLDLADPGDGAPVALVAGELGAEPLPADTQRGLGVQLRRVETDEIQVLVLTAAAGRLGIVARGGPDALELVGGNRSARAARAQQHAEVHEAVADGGGDGAR